MTEIRAKTTNPHFYFKINVGGKRIDVVEMKLELRGTISFLSQFGEGIRAKSISIVG